MNPRPPRRRPDPRRSWPASRPASTPAPSRRAIRRPADPDSTTPDRAAGSRPAAPRPPETRAAAANGPDDKVEDEDEDDVDEGRGDSGSRASLEAVVARLVEGWERGEPARAEDYLEQVAPADRVELIYHEYCLAEAAGHAPRQAEYLRRFPGHADALSRLFSLHEAFSTASFRRAVGPVDLPGVGDEVGPYRLLRELGRGAFARVFLAEQSDLGDRLVVVKVSTRPSSEPALLGRARHAHIVEVLRHIDDPDSSLHLVCLPFLGGATLGAVLDVRRRRARMQGRDRAPRSGRDFLADLDRASAPEYPSTGAARPAREIVARLSYPKALAWMAARLAEALDHAERRGVTHGDIKPSNILVTADGTPMLFDFNLAVDWHAAAPAPGSDLGGTLAYMPPERLRALADPARAAGDPRPARRRQPDRHRADLYSLGLVLAEALTGEPPPVPERKESEARSAASTLAEARGEAAAPHPALRSRRVPATLRAILARCLAADPGDRYARGAELAEDLDRWRTDRPPIYAPEPPGAAWPRRLRAYRWPLLAAGLTLAAALGAGLVASSLMQGTRRDQALAKWSHVLDRTDGVFTGRKVSQWRPDSPAEQGERAARNLALYDVANDPQWRRRDDVRSLPGRERAELEAWVLDQIYRRALALSDRPDPADWRRAVNLLDDALAGVAAAPLRDLRATLAGKLGADPAGRDRPPAGPAAPAWLEAYLAGVAAEQMRAREALGLYLDALKLRPGLFWAHYRASAVACRVDEYPAAARHLRECVARRPGNPWLHTQLGGLYLKLVQDGDAGPLHVTIDDAEAECNRALAIDPDFAEAHYTRTLIRQSRGQSASVRDDIDRFSILVGPLKPADPVELRLAAPLQYGLNFYRSDEVEEATLRRAILEDPGNNVHRDTLAIGLDPATRGDERIALLDEVLRFDPSHLSARFDRAVQRRREGDKSTAEFAALIAHPRFEEGFRYYPQMIRAYHYLATELLYRGQLAEAEVMARRSLDLIHRSRSLREETMARRDQDFTNLYPAAETYYLLARINSAAAATDPHRLAAAVGYLCDAFALQPDFRRKWFANDAVFHPNRAALLEQIDRAAGR